VLERISKYENLKQIGQGAMGTVYEGFDPVIGRRVAIKTLRTEVFDPSQLPEVLERFKREAQSAGRLSHPHIVTIFDYGEENGTSYIVMEFMSGKDLGVLLKRGVRFPLDEIVRIMTQFLGALAVAHQNGVVHRDLKPANMFLLDDGSLKVVDFGIAHVEASELTRTGANIGTPAYMSPEQVLGLPVDQRSDLFSVGVVLYQLLTGDRPFTGSAHSINQKILLQEPLAPTSLNPMLSAPWDAVITRALAKKPAARFQSARQFVEAIKLALDSEHSAASEHSKGELAENREEPVAEPIRKVSDGQRQTEPTPKSGEETVAVAHDPHNALYAVGTILVVVIPILFLLGQSPATQLPEANAMQVTASNSHESKGLPPCPGPYWTESWTRCTGTNKFINGDRYTGGYLDGKFEGQGTYIDRYGTTFVGEFRNGKRNGQGTYRFANRDGYFGNFKDDGFHGQGTYTWANGSKYVGEYKDNKFHGRGSLFGSNGSVQQAGIWEDGKFAKSK
jgi:serine/threonine protein kinase